MRAGCEEDLGSVQNDSKNHSKEGKHRASSLKQQATLDNGYGIMQDVFRKKKYMNDVNLKRIADAMEEILRLVKEDQAKTAERYKEYDKEDK